MKAAIIIASFIAIFLLNRFIARLFDLMQFRRQAARRTPVRFFITGEGWQTGYIRSFYQNGKLARVIRFTDSRSFLVPVKSLHPSNVTK